MTNKRRINRENKRKKRHITGKGILRFIVKQVKNGCIGIENLIAKNNLQRAQFGISVATLGTFSLLILSFFGEMPQITGVKINPETVRLFVLPAFLLILPGLSTLIEVTLIDKRFFAIPSNVLLMSGVGVFAFIIIELLKQFSYGPLLVYFGLFALLATLLIYKISKRGG